MELRYLVDVNLPKHFRFFNADNFLHVVDIDPSMSDLKIWQFALENNYIILTKDADFYHKNILSTHSPKIVYFQLGNMTLKELHIYFSQNWGKITNQLIKGNLILARRFTVEIIL
jgi:predicted nuclease of predicted toxin-antitoxin system